MSACVSSRFGLILGYRTRSRRILPTLLTGFSVGPATNSPYYGALEQDVSMWFEIYDAWGNKYLLERFTYQQAKAFCEKNEPPAGGSGPSARYSILPARQS